MTNLKIPEQLYVGLAASKNVGTPLSYHTPWGEDTAAKKRISTVDSWVNTSQANLTKIGTYIINNVPLRGFKLTGSIDLSFQGGFDKWQVEDPRGFLSVIPGDNLASILSTTVVVNGEIQDACIWARQGSKSLLIPVSSPQYKQAVTNTLVSKTKTSWHDVKFGYTIRLQNGIEGIYLGKVGVIERQYFDSSDCQKSESLLKVTSYNLSAILNEKSNIIHLLTNPRLSSIIHSDEMLQQDCESLANCYLENGAKLQSAKYFVRPVAVFCMQEKTDTVSNFSLELEVSHEQSPPRSYQKLVLCKHSDGFGEYVNFSNRAICYEIDFDALSCNQYVPKVIDKTQGYSTHLVQKHSQIDPTSISDYYHLYCNFETPCGSVQRIRI